jgi:hypothetical protein
MEIKYMMKKDRGFRLPKETKRLLAITPKEKRSQLKNLMIDAIILGSIEPPREKKKNKNRNSVDTPETE